MQQQRIESFDDLLTVARQQSGKQRLVVLLIKVDAVQSVNGQSFEGEGMIHPAQGRDFAINEQLSLAALRTQADEVAPGWRFFMAAVLTSSTGRMPASGDVDAQIKRMAWCVMSGEGLDAYAFFDREGEAVNLLAMPDRGTQGE